MLSLGLCLFNAVLILRWLGCGSLVCLVWFGGWVAVACLLSSVAFGLMIAGVWLEWFCGCFRPGGISGWFVFMLGLEFGVWCLVFVA